MNGQPESEQFQNFQERLSQWVSSQGFWFQLRYSLSGGGAKGALAFHLLKIATRLGIFIIILALGLVWFLARQTGTKGYHEKLKASFKEKLRAEEVEMQNFSREQGEFEIGRMAFKGGERTFFSGLEIQNMKCRMGMFDSMSKSWDPGLIEISSAYIDLRAGADSQQASKSMADVLFQDTGRVSLNSIQVSSMTMRWGYSDRSRGSIEGSNMRAQRLPDSWRLRFRGGTFTQNWLKRLEIVELDVVFGRQGILFETAIFKKNNGNISFSGLKVKAGERPDVSGKMILQGVDIASVVPAAVRNFVEGTFSGEFRVFGSTNSTEGVGFEGKVELDKENVIVIRDRIHLLKALSVVDGFNNYRRVDFNKGSFEMRSADGKLELTDVDIRAQYLFTMKGNLTVRQPNEEEAGNFDDSKGGMDQFDALIADDALNSEMEVTLRGAAESTNDKGKVGFKKAEVSLFDRLGLGAADRRLQETASERVFRTYRYEGDFSITLPKDAFSRAPQLIEAYPARASDGRIPMEVPISGVLYDLTLKQSEEIYKMGAR